VVIQFGDLDDGNLIRAALGTISRARGMAQLASDTGMSRVGPYTAFSAEGNPNQAVKPKLELAW